MDGGLEWWAISVSVSRLTKTVASLQLEASPPAPRSFMILLRLVKSSFSLTTSDRVFCVEAFLVGLGDIFSTVTFNSFIFGVTVLIRFGDGGWSLDGGE